MSLLFLSKIPNYEELPIAQAPPGVVPDFIHPESVAYRVYVMSAICVFLLLTVASVRLYVKKNILKSRTRDDIPYFIAIAMAISYIIMVIILLCQGGYGLHAWDVQLKVFTVDQLRLSLALESLYSPIIWIVKLPLFLMYLEVFGRLKWLRYMAWFVLVFTGLFFLSAMIAVSVLCAPTTGLGQLDYLSAIISPTCGQQSLVLSYIQGAITIATDVFLLVLPMPAIWSLKLPTHRKIGLSALILIGILGVVCSCLAIVYRVRQLRSDQEFNSDNTWEIIPLWIVIISEMTCALIVSAAPSLSVFCRKVVGPFASRLATSRFSLRSSLSGSDLTRTKESESSHTEADSSSDEKIWRTREYFVHSDYNSNYDSTGEDV